MQLEDVLELKVSGIGVSAVGKCSINLGGCACCCNDKIVAGGERVIDVSRSFALVGPKLVLTSFCGCHPSKKKNSKQMNEILELSSNHSLHVDTNEHPPVVHGKYTIFNNQSNL